MRKRNVEIAETASKLDKPRTQKPGGSTKRKKTTIKTAGRSNRKETASAIRMLDQPRPQKPGGSPKLVKSAKTFDLRAGKTGKE